MGAGEGPPGLGWQGARHLMLDQGSLVGTEISVVTTDKGTVGTDILAKAVKAKPYKAKLAKAKPAKAKPAKAKPTKAKPVKAKIQTVKTMLKMMNQVSTCKK